MADSCAWEFVYEVEDDNREFLTVGVWCASCGLHDELTYRIPQQATLF